MPDNIKNMQEKEDLTHIISKTKLKAEADALQAIGKKLVDLPIDKLRKLDLSESLLEAVIEAKRITSNGARRRQLQYIGRLMRDIDSEPIVEQLSRWEGKHQEENAVFHTLERWRDRLIEESNMARSEALQELVAKYPHTDIQKIRTLSRNAKKEQIANKPPRSSRELFKLLREIYEKPSQ